MKGFAIWLALIPELVILDQTTKWLALKFLAAPKVLIAHVLVLTPSLNTGASWSLPVPNFIMAAATPLILGIIIFTLAQHCTMNGWECRLPLMLLIAGGVSNLIDRLLKGGVVDFISLRNFPSFNLADMYITLAVFLLIAFYGRILRKDYGS